MLTRCLKQKPLGFSSSDAQNQLHAFGLLVRPAVKLLLWCSRWCCQDIERGDIELGPISAPPLHSQDVTSPSFLCHSMSPPACLSPLPLWTSATPLIPLEFRPLLPSRVSNNSPSLLCYTLSSFSSAETLQSSSEFLSLLPCQHTPRRVPCLSPHERATGGSR